MKDRLSLLDYLTLAVFGVQAAFALYIGVNGPTTPMPSTGTRTGRSIAGATGWSSRPSRAA